MIRLATAFALLVAGSGAAGAQVLGGGVAGGVGGAVGGATVGGALGGAARVDPSPALDGATGTVRDLDDSARKAADRTTPLKPGASVKAGAGVRVARGTRCYAEDDVDRYRPYDPAYRDGYYYCERTGPAVAAGARVKTR